jgi:hypothetical protein
MTLSSQMGPDMHLHVVHRFMVARIVSFARNCLEETNGRSKVAKIRIGANQVRSSAQITLYDCSGRPLQVEWMVQCKLSRVFSIVFELRVTRRNQFRRGQDHGAPMVFTARITRLGVAKSSRGHRGRVC